MPGEVPPATLEGWFALHQTFAVDWSGLRLLEAGERAGVVESAERLLGQGDPEGGWQGAFRLVGGDADLMTLHFRPTLDELADLQLEMRRSIVGDYLQLVYDFTSVTEAGLYHATAQVAAEHEPGSEAYERALEAERAGEWQSRHIRSRLYPAVPEGFRYLSFYPMNKRREGDENWYLLPIEERNRLMREHGLTGRRYSGRVFQVITGSVGFDDWEWGVTLFARDPLEFKRIVTEMRYDEVTARYGEFGPFFTGVQLEPGGWKDFLEVA